MRISSSAGEKDKTLPRNTRKKNERPGTTEHTEGEEHPDVGGPTGEEWEVGLSRGACNWLTHKH